MSLAQRLAIIQSATSGLRPRDIPIAFGSWRPDVETYPNPGLVTAKGVYRLSPQSYAPMPLHNPTSDALDTYARGAIAVRDTSAAVYMYAGNETKLYCC